MNIALSTILIFLFVLPGLAFRRFYYTGEFSKEYFKTTGVEIFFYALVPAIVFHAIGFNVIPIITPLDITIPYLSELNIPNLKIDIGQIGSLLYGSLERHELNKILASVEGSINYIVLYNISVSAIAGFFGVFCKALIRNLKWDRAFKIMRFQNEWHYILSSEILDFPKIRRNGFHNKEGKKLSFVTIDALVDVSEKEGGILYSGILEDYKLSKDGGLELIYLTESYRRYIKDDHIAESAKQEEEEMEDDNNNDEGPYYNLPDHYLVLKYSEIQNLNIYYEFEDSPKQVKELIGGFSILGLITYVLYLLVGILLAILILLFLIYVIGKVGEKVIRKNDQELIDENDETIQG